jgi:hypothetical protein
MNLSFRRSLVHWFSTLSRMQRAERARRSTRKFAASHGLRTTLPSTTLFRARGRRENSVSGRNHVSREPASAPTPRERERERERERGRAREATRLPIRPDTLYPGAHEVQSSTRSGAFHLETNTPRNLASPMSTTVPGELQSWRARPKPLHDLRMTGFVALGSQ